MKTLSLLILLLITQKQGYTEVSWYGNNFNGKKTASGEYFNENKLTGASPTLPFHTLVKVTNLENNKSVIIRINDRGPYKVYNSGRLYRPLQPHPKRLFDLSKAAFKAIANSKRGRIKVRYKVL